MPSVNGHRPEYEISQEIPFRCMDLAGLGEYVEASILNEQGVPAQLWIPVVFRRRCKNSQCCPPRDGHIAVHRWKVADVALGDERLDRIGVGEYITEYVPNKPIVGASTSITSRVRSSGEIKEHV